MNCLTIDLLNAIPLTRTKALVNNLLTTCFPEKRKENM